MTTIAYDGNTIAADRLCDQNGLRVYMEKLYTVDFADNQSGILGVAGFKHWAVQLHAKLSARTLSDALKEGVPEYDQDKFYPSAILAMPSGLAWYLSGSVWVPLQRRFHAVGSGRDFAIAVMALGKTAKEAVTLAIEFDSGSGGPVDVAIPTNRSR